jgi:hypothetical protein
MTKILMPTQSLEDWRRLLARPERHWKTGFSAMTLASAWEAAAGLPPEIRRAFAASGRFHGIEPILIMPEFKVALPGGARDSQTDVFVLARTPEGLATIAVEGKVDEPFGPTLAERGADPSNGVEQRLRFLRDCLGLSHIPGTVRYQLLHRTASAVLLARQFFAPRAVMLVHSFSPTNRWFEDFVAFAGLFGSTPNANEIILASQCGGVELHIAWCRGDQRFRSEAVAPQM